MEEIKKGIEIKPRANVLLVIPEYNDSQRLNPFLKWLCQELTSEYDILIVDDGSNREEKQLLDNLIKEQWKIPSECKVNLPLSYIKNQGKGAAIRKGFAMRGPHHKYVAFVDADGAISPKEIMHLKSIIMENPDLDAVLASRVEDKNTTIERKWYRKIIGTIFSSIVKNITKLKIKDTQCGLKIFKSEAYNKIEPHLTINGFPIDIEICCLLEHQKHKYKEVPISWKEITGSKVRLIQDSLYMLIETFKIKSRVNKT